MATPVATMLDEPVALTRRSALGRLVSFLHTQRIAYCLMGDPYRVCAPGSFDVDLIVSPTTLEKIPRLLRRFCLDQGYRLVNVIPGESSRQFVVAFDDHAGDPQFLFLDFCDGAHFGGRRYLDAASILTNRKLIAFTPAPDGKVYVPDGPVAYIYYVLKRVEKLSIAPPHAAYLSGQFSTDPSVAHAWLRRFWPQADVRLLASAASSGDWQAVRDRLVPLRRSLRRRAGGALRAHLRSMRPRIARLLRPPGLFLAVLGPDGSGKSSIIQRVNNAFEPAFASGLIMHFRPHFTRRGRNGASPILDPHGMAPRSPLASVAKLLYYYLDYVLGYWMTVLPALSRVGLVVFDRYYDDMLVDPRRYRLEACCGLARRLRRLVPSPGLLILLDVPADVLQRRKQEVSYAESKRQREAYRALVRRLPYAAIIDASQPLDAVARDVRGAVLSYLERRTAYWVETRRAGK